MVNRIITYVYVQATERDKIETARASMEQKATSIEHSARDELAQCEAKIKELEVREIQLKKSVLTGN